MADSVKSDKERQFAKAREVYDFLSLNFGQWVGIFDIIAATQALSVSTKISQARAIAAEHHEEIKWNGNVRASAYMLRPISLGPSAETERSGQRTLPGIGISSLNR